MYISYNNLLKKLIDLGVKKGEICRKTGISSTLAKISQNEPVSLSIILKICEILDYSIEEVISVNKKSEWGIVKWEIANFQTN